MKRLALALFAAFLSVAGASVARADGEQTGSIVLRTGDREPTGGWKFVGIRVRWGTPASGTGWGFVRVLLENTDDKPVDVRLSIEDYASASRARRSVHLGAKGKAEAWIPRLPIPGQDRLKVSVRDEEEWFSNSDSGDALNLLSIGDSSARGPPSGTEAIYLALTSSGRKSGYSPHARGSHALPASDIPPSWTYLTGTPLIVVHGSARGLDDAERQRTLADYVEAGGAVLVLDRDALPKGPLADLTAPDSGDAESPWTKLRGGTRGFGRWAITSSRELDASGAAEFVATWLPEKKKGSASSIARGGMLEALAVPLRIPGLGRVDVRLFFFLLLVFAILVGPVAYLLLKRRRRLTLMLAVVPATGILFATGILAYGLLSEGLGTRGAVESVTFLDQRAHTATCVAGRTVFAGWGASSLRLSPDTMLAVPPTAEESRYGYGYRSPYAAPNRMSLDADAGVIEDTVLPSRTVTTLASVTHTRARERIRFRARADGGYDVLSAEGFAPAFGVAPRGILLRDAKGDLYASKQDGEHLERVTAKGGATSLEAFLGAAVEVPHGGTEEDPDFDPTDYSYGYRYTVSDSGERETLAESRQNWIRRIVPETLPKSSYVAWTTRAPAFDDVGLTVEWRHARHLVFGLLAPEDFDGQ